MARIKTTDTSLKAWQEIQPHAPSLRIAVYRMIRGRRNGATCEDVELALELSHQSASARVNELVYEGLIVDLGVRAQNSSGRTAIVWRAVDPKDAVPLTRPEKPIRGVAKSLYKACKSSLAVLADVEGGRAATVRREIEAAMVQAEAILDVSPESQV